MRGTISPGQEYFGRCCWEGERTGLQQIELLLAGPQGEECSGASEPLEGASLWIRNDEQQEVENIVAQALLEHETLTGIQVATIVAGAAEAE